MTTPRRHPATPDGAFDLDAAGAELLEQARVESGRAARTLAPGGGAPLKQTLLALVAGQELAEHRTAGTATLTVLRGGVVLSWGDTDLVVPAGHWAAIPDQSHALRADDDAVILLTVASGV